MSRRIVVALGGNAILTDDASAEAQQKTLLSTAKNLVKFVENGDQLIIAHGNGPQVGNLLLQQAASNSKKNPAMPLNTCVAMTQGGIGYWIQKAMDEVMAAKGISKRAVSIVTQIKVNNDDPAFKRPTKTIGPFMSKDEASKYQKAHPNYTVVEDAGRGYRRAVPSPQPINILESNAVEDLADKGMIPISVGGGGVAVSKKGNSLNGEDAVIDKDFASAELAEETHADALITLTAVKNVYVNYNKPDQKALTHVNVSDMEKYIKQHQFPEGSMLPKVQAAINYVKNTGNEAVITALGNIDGYLKDHSGTIITKD